MTENTSATSAVDRSLISGTPCFLVLFEKDQQLGGNYCLCAAVMSFLRRCPVTHKQTGTYAGGQGEKQRKKPSQLVIRSRKRTAERTGLVMLVLH
jgi:hypothetical protein